MTGGRFLPDGNIEFLGRLDDQIKIRGYRVEPGEIETRLSRHTEVREAIVVAREERPGEKRLVAYLVSDSDPAPEPGALKSYLQGVLPDYMVPAAYVMLDAFPLGPNGKVDRKALPEPETSLGQETIVAPNTDTEALLTRIWAEVLRVDRVGIHDDFFDIGGDSLLTFQVIAKANQAGLHLTAAQLLPAADHRRSRPSRDAGRGRRLQPKHPPWTGSRMTRRRKFSVVPIRPDGSPASLCSA